MGKKKDEEVKEEGYEFIPPDFDEEAFIHKEMIGFRTTVTLFLVGILAAVVSWGLFMAVDGAKVGWLLGMVVFAVFFALLKPLYKKLRIDIGHYQRREWIGTGFLLFFTWLAFWMILINPPVSDFAEPQVEVYASPGVAETDGSVVIDVFYTDNAGVEARTFSITGPGGTLADENDLQRVTGPHYRYTATGLAAGTYTVEATGTDAKGLTGEGNNTFEVRDDVIDVFTEDLTTPTGAIVITVPLEPRDVYAVYLDLVDRDDRVYLEYEESLGGWKATRQHAGWSEGNNTFTVHVEQVNQFHGNLPIPGGILSDDENHTVQVSAPGDYSGGVPKRANPTVAPAKDVPGIGVALLAVGLLGTAVVVRRRRE